jgi:hypothetical protein
MTPDDMTLAHALRMYREIDDATVDHDRGCMCEPCQVRRRWANEAVRRAKAADLDLAEVAREAGKDLTR